jgi:hypothetical protein
MESRPLLAALFCLLLCCIAGEAHGTLFVGLKILSLFLLLFMSSIDVPGATHEMNPSTDLTALVAAITASPDTDHVVHVASGTFFVFVNELLQPTTKRTTQEITHKSSHASAAPTRLSPLWAGCRRLW